MRTKKRQKSDSGSGSNNSDANSTLIKSESFSGPISQESTSANGSEEDSLAKPNFQLGPYTPSTLLGSASSAKLGSLAQLAFYNGEMDAPVRETSFGTEENSNVSDQQAWDDYQEKYMSEAYSEGFDSDAARKLLEFGDDYRNFLDSQSDACSSLSAANNLDSLSPPRYRKHLGLINK